MVWEIDKTIALDTQGLGSQSVSTKIKKKCDFVLIAINTDDNRVLNLEHIVLN